MIKSELSSEKLKKIVFVSFRGFRRPKFPPFPPLPRKIGGNKFPPYIFFLVRNILLLFYGVNRVKNQDFRGVADFRAVCVWGQIGKKRGFPRDCVDFCESGRAARLSSFRMGSRGIRAGVYILI